MKSHEKIELKTQAVCRLYGKPKESKKLQFKKKKNERNIPCWYPKIWMKGTILIYFKEIRIHFSGSFWYYYFVSGDQGKGTSLRIYSSKGWMSPNSIPWGYLIGGLPVLRQPWENLKCLPFRCKMFVFREGTWHTSLISRIFSQVIGFFYLCVTGAWCICGHKPMDPRKRRRFWLSAA